MKHRFYLVLCFCMALGISAHAQKVTMNFQQVKKAPVDYVDPFICTYGDCGQWHPAALCPFGTVKLGPDTYPGSLVGSSGVAHGGYNYRDTQVRGFSHFKQGSSGSVGITDRAGIFSILPYAQERDPEWYRTPVVSMDKNQEKATPGYYTTYLVDDKIKVELTSNVHSGFHRYTYTQGTDAKILINQGNLVRTDKITCRVLDNYTLEGYVGQFYYYMKFSHPIQNTWIKDENGFLKEGKVLSQNHKHGFVCSFGDLKGESLVIKVGVSLTDQLSARNNFEAECPGVDFDTNREIARDSWSKILNRIMVEGQDEELKTIFYTALYHSCFFPVSVTNVDGTYLGLDWEKHKADGYVHYDGYAFWDSFRSKYTLFGFLVPEVYKDIVYSLRDLYEQTDFELCAPPNIEKLGPHNYSYCIRSKKGVTWPNCRHEHMLMVMTDAYRKGFFGSRIELKDVYPYMRKELMTQMPEYYDQFKYVPKSPDKSCEYSWDSWCMAYLAKELGYKDDYTYFMKRSEYWKNSWDCSIKFFRARGIDGKWLDFPEDPTVNREKYTYEGTKWQYRWHSLHDVPGLIELFGGKEFFLKELNYFFDNNLYNAGNQPDIHVPFLFNMAGAPWKTQEWVNKILTKPILQRYGTHGFLSKPVFDKVYKSTPDGYLEEMDDDYGCMSSWFAISALGLFQYCPGQPVYQLFSPIFDNITIQLGDNKFLRIEAKGLTSEKFYIKSATFNGVPYDKSYITHEELMNGGKLVFDMESEPNKNWGRN